MTETIVILLLILLIGGIWYGLTRKSGSVPVNPAIEEALGELIASIQDVTLHLESDAASERADLALDKVRMLLNDAEAITVIDDAWTDLKAAINEFAIQPTNSTLQSSILTTRIQKRKDQILQTVQQVLGNKP